MIRHHAQVQSREQETARHDGQFHLHQQGDLPARARSRTPPTPSTNCTCTSLDRTRTTPSRAATLKIKVAVDKDARTLTISDNGIGMTAEELERNLGTIAHSGSLALQEGQRGRQDLDRHRRRHRPVRRGLLRRASWSRDHVARRAPSALRRRHWPTPGRATASSGYEVGPALEARAAPSAAPTVTLCLRPRQTTTTRRPTSYLNESAPSAASSRAYTDYVRHPIQVRDREEPRAAQARGRRRRLHAASTSSYTET